MTFQPVQAHVARDVSQQSLSRGWIPTWMATCHLGLPPVSNRPPMTFFCCLQPWLQELQPWSPSPLPPPATPVSSLPPYPCLTVSEVSAWCRKHPERHPLDEHLHAKHREEKHIRIPQPLPQRRLVKPRRIAAECQADAVCGNGGQDEGIKELAENDKDRCLADEVGSTEDEQGSGGQICGQLLVGFAAGCAAAACCCCCCRGQLAHYAPHACMKPGEEATTLLGSGRTVWLWLVLGRRLVLSAAAGCVVLLFAAVLVQNAVGAVNAVPFWMHDVNSDRRGTAVVAGKVPAVTGVDWLKLWQTCMALLVMTTAIMYASALDMHAAGSCPLRPLWSLSSAVGSNLLIGVFMVCTASRRCS